MVDHTTKGQANIYHPLVERQQVMRELLQNLFGGSPARAVQSLLDSSPVDDDEMSQIHQLLAEVEQKQMPAAKQKKRKPRRG